MQNQAEIFDVLKHILKAHGKTYSDLGRDIGVSEPTIKRIFSDKDCKFSRLLTICAALDISISDVIEASANFEEPLQYMDKATEAYFAANPEVFFFFMLLKDGMQSQEIKHIFNLSEIDIFHYGQNLEQMALASIDTQGRIILTSTHAVKIDPKGPLNAIYCDINLSFVKLCFQAASEDVTKIRSMSRRMLPETANALKHKIDEVYTEIAKQARLDKLVAKPHDLITIKWLTTIGPAKLEERFNIGAHPKSKTI